MAYAPVSAGTWSRSAVGASLLSIAGAMVWLVWLATAVIEVFRHSIRTLFPWESLAIWQAALYTVVNLTSILLVPLLAVGGILLLYRSNIGRVLVILASALVLIGYWAVVVAHAIGGRSISDWTFSRWLFGHSPLDNAFDSGLVLPWPICLALSAFPVMTLILCALPSTRSWCARSEWGSAQSGITHHPL
ncbi:hypothetical protein [Nocardia cyriacigeorgica]|uniref:hypothetical protein n=1 Tax=Nocardia cyriacigeorgica TaxID=135487 RepID=UPI0024538CB6|nr:hypothetical protein [Nocardia cyriacigeorgica]